MAPEGFGEFSGALLVGNFGDGRIHAYEPQSDGGYLHRGVMRGQQQRHPDRRAVGDRVRQRWRGGPSTSLYFTAGPDDEGHGLFGRIDALDS